MIRTVKLPCSNILFLKRLIHMKLFPTTGKSDNQRIKPLVDVLLIGLGNVQAAFPLVKQSEKSTCCIILFPCGNLFLANLQIISFKEKLPTTFKVWTALMWLFLHEVLDREQLGAPPVPALQLHTVYDSNQDKTRREAWLCCFYFSVWKKNRLRLKICFVKWI